MKIVELVLDINTPRNPLLVELSRPKPIHGKGEAPWRNLVYHNTRNLVWFLSP